MACKIPQDDLRFEDGGEERYRIRLRQSKSRSKILRLSSNIINIRGDRVCYALCHTPLYMRVAGRDFRIPLTQGFLDDTQIFRFGIKVCPAAVTKSMAAHAELLVAELVKDAVHYRADAVPAEALAAVAIGK